MERAGQMDYRSIGVSPKEAAAFLKLSERTFYRLVENGTLPKSENGKYKLGEIVDAYWSSKFDPEGLNIARTRLVTAQAELAESELAIERGELYRGSAIIEMWEKQVNNVRSKLLAIPVKIAPEIIGLNLNEAVEKLKFSIYEALNELSGEFKR